MQNLSLMNLKNMDSPFEPQLILCDIEGCLMPADRSEARPENLAGIASYCAAAKADSSLPPMVFCTGRQAPYAECLGQIIGAVFPGIPSIVENGAFLYDIAENRMIRNPALKGAFMERRSDLVSKLDGWLEKRGGRREPGKEICISLNPPGGNAIEDFCYEVKAFIGVNAGDYNITHSKSAVDITPAGIDKAAGLDHLISVTGIFAENIIGIGDTAGDLPMLTRVGLPAVPFNASDDVKNIAKFVSTYSETDGVTDILKRFTDWK